FVQRSSEHGISTRVERHRSDITCMAHFNAAGTALLDIPDLHIPVIGGCHEPPAIRAKAGVTYQFMLTERLGTRGPAAHVPEPRRVVRRCGNNCVSVGAEFSEAHSALVPQSRPDRIARFGVPQS